MQVRHILRDKGREVVTIFSDATLSEASRLLASKRIGAVVVRDRDGGLAGMLSERDIVRALAEASVPRCCGAAKEQGAVLRSRTEPFLGVVHNLKP